MDYSLLLGVHYRAPQHLRPLISYNQSIISDGLGSVAEEGVSCLQLHLVTPFYSVELVFYRR